jgi:hypothetical protein
MEQERNLINGATSVVLSGMIDFLAPLKWFALLGLVLIIADLRFGIEAARVRGEKIRFSRAGRRTVNKLVDYTCWIFLTAALSKAFVPFDIPLFPSLVLLVIYGFEINSCFTNYFEARGKKVKVDIFGLLKKKIEIIEIKEEDTDEIQQTKS